MFEFGLFSLVSLFTMINPVGIVPVFVSMTNELSSQESRQVALKATLTSFGILIGFALTGELIFDFFSISVDSLRVVGGIIFFMMGYDMLQARMTRIKHDEETTPDFVEDIAITPLGIPVMCGPGSITTVMILMTESETLLNKVALFSAIVIVLSLTLISLLSAKKITALIGVSGNKVIMRLMGLIVMVIAVEFFFSGIKPFVQAMLSQAMHSS